MANRDTKLSIIIEARNKAEAAFAQMNQSLKDAQSNVENLSGSLKTVGTYGVAAFAGLATAAFAFVKAGAEFEQTQVAFSTMIGSAEKANKLLQEMAEFASKTPFQLTDLEKASKSLLAYGVTVEELLPTLQMLGDITAGVGMDKLPQLILAFGQVRAATKLTGSELRQFTEAGVPILDALVQHFNKVGPSMKTVTNAAGLTSKQIDKLGKSNEGLVEKIRKAEIQLDKQQNRMREMRKNGNDSSASYKNLKIDISETERTIASLNAQLTKGTVTMGKANTEVVAFGDGTKYTAQQVMEMVSNGEVAFADVQAALAGMTGEGGRFFQMMEQQSMTLAGLWSNLQDQFSLTARSIGQELVPVLKPMIDYLIVVMGQVRAFVEENPKFSAGIIVAATALAGMLALLLPIGLALSAIVATVPLLTAGLAAVKVAVLAINAAMLVWGFIIVGIGALIYNLIYNWQDLWDMIVYGTAKMANAIQVIFESVVNFFIDGINYMIEKVNTLIDKLNSIPGMDNKIGKIDTFERVQLQRFDTDLLLNDLIYGDRATGKSTVVNITGNTLLDEDAAEKIGDQMMSRLKMSNAI